MGSKRKKMWVAQQAAIQKQNQINNYNSGERTRGANLDNNAVVQKQAIVQKEGTVDYKKFLKSRLADLTNVLGVKK